MCVIYYCYISNVLLDLLLFVENFSMFVELGLDCGRTGSDGVVAEIRNSLCAGLSFVYQVAGQKEFQGAGGHFWPEI